MADALRSLLGHVFGGIQPLSLLRSQPETWAGWSIPPERVTRMFAAAAAFHRAAPWSISSTEMPIFVSRAGGHEWAAVILGGGGEQTGLTFYHNPADLERMMTRNDNDPAAAFQGMENEILSLLFNTRTEIPKQMRDEIKSARWEIAGPSAYPTLLVMNTPGGGIRQRHFDDLVAALVSVPRFVAAHAAVFRGALPDDSEIAWTDAETAVTCRLNFGDEFSPDFADAPLVLFPAGAEGPGAQPRAALDRLGAERAVNETLQRFYTWLRTPTTRKAPAESTVAKHMSIAEYFVTHCAYGSFKPLHAVNEYDLRTFLYDWYPRSVGGTERAARSALVSLRRFFEFLEAREGVRCPWSTPILDDTDEFIARLESWPGGPDGDAESEVARWRMACTFDLAARLLIPIPDAQSGIVWRVEMGDVEQALNLEAHRLWLVYRDDAVRSGTSAPEEVLSYAVEQQRAWANAPNANYGGITPKEAITRERG